MGLRNFLYLLLVLLLGAVGISGWVRNYQNSRELQGIGFVRQRAAFLEAENKRLNAVLVQKEAAENNAGERRQRDAIEKEVTALSSLNFLHPVVFKEIPRSELPTVLNEKLARQVPDQEFSNVALELSALGLVPAGIDLKKVYLGLLGEQVGAFYDQHTHELFTFSDHPLTNAQNRVVMAHELTHALQDQHFDLLKLPLEMKGNDDRALAASALVEGDATLVMNAYLVGDLSAAVVRDSLAGAFSTDVRQLAAAPRYLRETLLFPYLQGQQFVTALSVSGGRAAIAAAFGNPPNSTSEIMHPEKYLASPREQPVQIVFPEISVLGKQPAVDNVVGEFTAVQILELWTHDKARAGRVAEGWRGDRVLVYGDASAHSLLWQTVWRDQETAQAYCQAGGIGLAARYGKANSKGPGADPQSREIPSNFSLNSGGRQLRVIRAGTRTTLIDAQDEKWADALSRVAEASSGNP